MSKGENCKIYFEKNDLENVYIEVNDLSDCCFEIWDIDGDKQSRARIKVPVEVWKRMLKKWKTSKVEEERYDYL